MHSLDSNDALSHTLSSLQITQSSGSNFSAAFFFLPKPKRRALCAVYAFCRVVDDAVDEAPSLDLARQRLSFWKIAFEQVCKSPVFSDAQSTQYTELPLLIELQQAIETFEIPIQYFEDLLSGVEMDLHKNRYNTFEELTAYTYGVAEVVGLICMKIFGGAQPLADSGARLLGRAVQLTNILRDIKADAACGRIYLPEEDLKRFSITEEEFLSTLRSDFPRGLSFFEHLENTFQHWPNLPQRLLALFNFEIERTRSLYQEAFHTLAKLPRKPLLAALLMGRLYEKILSKISKDPLQICFRKVSLSKFEKAAVLFYEWIGF